ncbi:solute carrier family 13-like protein 2, partial [Leptotrombidium deliense]
MYQISWRSLSIVLTPLILSPLLIFLYESKEARCGFMVLLMAVYWTLEPIPTPVTALLPVVLMPTLGLATTEDACKPYLQATNMLFLGCLMFAIAVENSNLHKRIALKILCFIGSDYKYLLLGFMLTTAFLGMWIINTAAAAMMLPIVDAVITEIFPENDIVDEAEVQLQPVQCTLQRDREEETIQINNTSNVTKDERIYQ